MLTSSPTLLPLAQLLTRSSFKRRAPCGPATHSCASSQGLNCTVHGASRPLGATTATCTQAAHQRPQGFAATSRLHCCNVANAALLPLSRVRGPLLPRACTQQCPLHHHHQATPSSPSSLQPLPHLASVPAPHHHCVVRRATEHRQHLGIATAAGAWGRARGTALLPGRRGRAGQA